MSPLSANTAPHWCDQTPCPPFVLKRHRFPRLAGPPAVGHTSSRPAPSYGKPFWHSGLACRAATASQAKRRWRLWLGPRAWQHKEPWSPGRGGADSHCAACSRGHRRCRQGPRWRFGAIRWWLSSDNLHNRCRLSWRPTGRGGAASAGWAPTLHLDLPPRPSPHPRACQLSPGAGKLTGESRNLRSHGILELET